jgi:hypothetical protein
MNKQDPPITFHLFHISLKLSRAYHEANLDANGRIKASNLLISHGSFWEMLPAHNIWSTLKAIFPSQMHGVYCVTQPFEYYVHLNYVGNISSYITENKAKHLWTLNMKVLRL